MEFLDDNRSNSDEEENDVNSSKQENLNWFKSSDCTVISMWRIERSCFVANGFWNSNNEHVVVVAVKEMTLKLVIFFVTIISLPTLQFIFMFLIFWQTWKQSFPFIYSNFIPKFKKKYENS